MYHHGEVAEELSISREQLEAGEAACVDDWPLRNYRFLSYWVGSDAFRRERDIYISGEPILLSQGL